MQLIIIFILIVLSSCSTPHFATGELLVQPTSTEFSSKVPEQTPQPTATPKPDDTVTPLATYTSDQAYQKIISWLVDSSGCRLPCVWGFQPGATDREQIKDSIFSRFDEMYINEAVSIWVHDFDDLGGITLILEDSGIQSDIRMSYYFEGMERVNLISLLIDSHQIEKSGDDTGPQFISTNEMLEELVTHYTFASVLQEFGTPSSVLVAPYYEEEPGGVRLSWIWYSIVLIFEDQGILAEYIMPRRMIGDTYAACVKQIVEISIITWNPKQPIPLDEIVSVSSFLGIGKNNIDYFMPLEEATSITIEDFADIFQDTESTACVYTPRELWPNP